MPVHHDYAFPAEVLSVDLKFDSSEKRDPPSSLSLSPPLLHAWLTFSEHSTNIEDSTPLSHCGEDISYHAAYKILKNALTPTPSKSTNTGQDSEQKQARADIGKKSLMIWEGSSSS
jgi:hypothetical protein